MVLDNDLLRTLNSTPRCTPLVQCASNIREQAYLCILCISTMFYVSGLNVQLGSFAMRNPYSLSHYILVFCYCLLRMKHKNGVSKNNWPQLRNMNVPGVILKTDFLQSIDLSCQEIIFLFCQSMQKIIFVYQFLLCNINLENYLLCRIPLRSIFTDKFLYFTASYLDKQSR